MKALYQQTIDGEVEVIETPNGIKEVKEKESIATKKLGKWEFEEVFFFLKRWMKIFVEEFDLLDGLFDTLPNLEIGKVSNKKACFKAGYTSRGEAVGTILFNSNYVKIAKKRELLATLLHELVHVQFWEDYLKNDKLVKHGKKFVERMMSFGIAVDRKGQHLRYCKTLYLLPDRKSGQKEGWIIADNGKNLFFEILRKHGVEFSEEENIQEEPATLVTKKKVSWKEKYLELATQVENLQHQLAQMKKAEVSQMKETKVAQMKEGENVNYPLTKDQGACEEIRKPSVFSKSNLAIDCWLISLSRMATS